MAFNDRDEEKEQEDRRQGEDLIPHDESDYNLPFTD
jgi:hypothetical protein